MAGKLRGIEDLLGSFDHLVVLCTESTLLGELIGSHAVILIQTAQVLDCLRCFGGCYHAVVGVNLSKNLSKFVWLLGLGFTTCELVS